MSDYWSAAQRLPTAYLLPIVAQTENRVGVKHIVVEDEENAEAVLLTLHCVGAIPCLQLGLVSIIVFDRRDLLVVRHVKVVVEIPAKRRKPRDTPSLLRFVGLELGEWGAR